MLELANYPLFSPPDALAAIPRRQWTTSEAKRYFDWLLSQTETRTTVLLFFVGIRDAEKLESRRLVSEAAQHVCLVLRDPLCSHLSDTGKPALTRLGYSLAADLGLLAARQIQRAAGESVAWEIVRSPARDVSYNLPVLRIGADTYDPIGVSIADAIAVLAGRRTADAWINVFDSCVADAKGRMR